MECSESLKVTPLDAEDPHRLGSGQSDREEQYAKIWIVGRYAGGVNHLGWRAYGLVGLW
jgi:hypothetical protein